MQKLKQNAKKLCVKLLSITAILNAGCTSKEIPSPPIGNLYNIDVPDKKLLCAGTESGDNCPAIAFDQKNSDGTYTMDKMYCMTSDYWMANENYIGTLLLLIKQNTSTVSPMEDHVLSGDSVSVRVEDIQEVKDQMWFLRKTLEQKRKHK